MKRNYMQLVTTHAASITTDKPMSFVDFKAKVIAAVHADISLRIARKYLRDHAPALSKAQRIELDRDIIWAVAEAHGVQVYEASKNATLSGLTVDRKEAPQAYNAIEYMRLTLKGINKHEKAKDAKAEKKNLRSTPKAEAARIAKAHADAGYLMSLAQALMVEANKLVAAK